MRSSLLVAEGVTLGQHRSTQKQVWSLAERLDVSYSAPLGELAQRIDVHRLQMQDVFDFEYAKQLPPPVYPPLLPPRQRLQLRLADDFASRSDSPAKILRERRWNTLVEVTKSREVFAYLALEHLEQVAHSIAPAEKLLCLAGWVLGSELDLTPAPALDIQWEAREVEILAALLASTAFSQAVVADTDLLSEPQLRSGLVKLLTLMYQQYPLPHSEPLYRLQGLHSELK